MNFATLSDALRARRLSSGYVTYIDGDKQERQLIFGEIHARALGLLHHLQAKGASPGDEVILLLDNNQQFIEAFWACMLGGMVAVPVAPGINDEHRRKFFRIWSQLQVPHLCSDSKIFARLESHGREHGQDVETGKIRLASLFLDQIDDISVPGNTHACGPDETAMVQFSSGSTSEPKGVVLSHRNLLANIGAIARAMDLRPDDTALSWMPLTHDMGLIGFHLTWLVNDISHHLIPTSLFVRRPSLWLTKASEKHASLLCSPNFGYKHFLKACDDALISTLDLSGVRLVFNGAEPISVELCRQFMTRMAPAKLKSTAMFPVYGLAEASLAVTFPTPGTNYKSVCIQRSTLGVGDEVRAFPASSANTIELACVGHEIDHVALRIADNDGNALPENRVGRIMISGTNVTSGYYRNPQATHSAITVDGWLDTGDLGFMSSHGLVVTGRLKEIIFVSGQNHYPQDIEVLLDKHADIELGKVAVAGVRPANSNADEVLVFVLHRGKPREFLDIIRRARKCINEQIGVAVDHVIPVNRIPKTTSGKIQRYLLAREFEQGNYDAVLAELGTLEEQAHGNTSANTASSLESALKEICNAYIKEKPLDINDNIFEAGTSSLTLAQIYQRIDTLYPGHIEVTDFFDYPTIAELAKFLEKRLETG